jgi:uncharacterized protein (DUF1015 family)
MATIKPLKAIRPVRDKIHLVASRSYISYDRESLHAKLSENPFSFIHIINPEFGKPEKTAPNSNERFEKVRERFDEFVSDNVYMQDEKPGFYIYRQTQPNNTFTGIIGAAAIDDYINGVIKIHEQTITARQEVFKNYLKVTDFHAEPVLLTYADQKPVDAIIGKKTLERPEYEFTTTDLIKHELWIIQDESHINTIEESFAGLDAIYIADGHHRSASSALLGEERRAEKANFSGKEAFNYYMSIFIPESQLKIYAFNRLVKDLGISKMQFFNEVEKNFEVEEQDASFKPQALHEFSLYLDQKWYKLTAKLHTRQGSSSLSDLDAEILSNYLLSPVLGITDLKTDPRIDFMGDLYGNDAMKKKVDKGEFELGIGLYPVSTQQLKDIADHNETMPPKSTWIEPKIRSGLTIFSLSDEM